MYLQVAGGGPGSGWQRGPARRRSVWQWPCGGGSTTVGGGTTTRSEAVVVRRIGKKWRHGRMKIAACGEGREGASGFQIPRTDEYRWARNGSSASHIFAGSRTQPMIFIGTDEFKTTDE
jgi:hypothetical protein